MNKPLHYQQFELPFKAVLLRCLNEDQQVIANTTGSGFIRRERNGYFLYTCWHLVTGYDPNNIVVTNVLPDRRYLEVAFQDADERQPGVTAIGGLQTVVLPLYDLSSNPARPAWFQDQQDSPNADLNAIGLYVPFWHDAVKLRLPDDIRVTDMQFVAEDQLLKTFTILPHPGEIAFVVGFPYGFSAVGGQQPTPVVLTRFIAATRVEGRNRDMLLESAGAPGMSGGPVFVIREGNIKLLGLYTGLIYPDHILERNERTTALGTCVDMMLCWDHMELVQRTYES